MHVCTYVIVRVEGCEVRVEGEGLGLGCARGRSPRCPRGDNLQQHTKLSSRAANEARMPCTHRNALTTNAHSKVNQSCVG